MDFPGLKPITNALKREEKMYNRPINKTKRKEEDANDTEIIHKVSHFKSLFPSTEVVNRAAKVVK